MLSSNLLISVNPWLCLVSSSFLSPGLPRSADERRWAQITRIRCYQISRRKVPFSPQHVFVTHQRLKRFFFSLSFVASRNKASTNDENKLIGIVAWRQRLKSPDPRRWNVALWNDFLLRLCDCKKKPLLSNNLGFSNLLDQGPKISQMTTTWWSSLSQNQTPSLSFEFVSQLWLFIVSAFHRPTRRAEKKKP